MKMSRYNIKPLFGIDITSDKNNDTVNGTEFITYTASNPKKEEFERKAKNLEQIIKKSEFPFWFHFIKGICAGFFLVTIVAIIKAGFEKAFKNASILVIGSILCGILWVVLQVASKWRKSKVLKDENAQQKSEGLREDLDALRAELGIPKDAVETDILVFRYTVKNGEIRPYSSLMQPVVYINLSGKMYATSDELHIADISRIYSFKKSDLKAIITVNKKIFVTMWHKKDDPREGRFKPHKITVNRAGHIFFKPHYILKIEHNDQVYGLYFPCYELETIEKLTGLKAE